MADKINEEQAVQDRCNLRTIYDVFDYLSPKGKVICIENLVRMFGKEINGEQPSIYPALKK